MKLYARLTRDAVTSCHDQPAVPIASPPVGFDIYCEQSRVIYYEFYYLRCTDEVTATLLFYNNTLNLLDYLAQ